MYEKHIGEWLILFAFDLFIIYHLLDLLIVQSECTTVSLFCVTVSEDSLAWPFILIGFSDGFINEN